ncbi:MAG: hypothetical protein QOF60_2882 [Actinomycetota bacterium]|jgi:hypothetical protein|nr:hypothetical protein [Actinomycetota bacterium]
MSTDLGTPAVEEFSSSGPCPACGFDPDDVTPYDAAMTLRSFPRRWRSGLAMNLDDPDPEGILSGRPAPGQWTALEHAGHVRDVLHALDIRLQRVLREEEPVLPETHVTPPSGANEQGMAVVLAALSVSADQLARTIEQTPSSAWSRTGRRAGRTVSAIALVREAVHEGGHHLHQALDVLEELRLPTTSSLN